ncbi:hypothetical protein VWZ88_01300 [Phaeobacter sp. JH20_36]|uniref:hypothetical protein n=1 Tax=unclassified Phaeobacter TaxID=2621772 RepID=UPI003A891F16
MTIKISGLIACLKAAQDKYGDLPIYTTDSDIKSLGVHPCCDGVQTLSDDAPEVPNELVIEFVPCD